MQKMPQSAADAIKRAREKMDQIMPRQEVPTMMFTKIDNEQLRQIAAASPHPGVHAGDLISKPSARMLVEKGLAKNSGGSPSSLAYVTITQEGRNLLDAVDEINRKST